MKRKILLSTMIIASLALAACGSNVSTGNTSNNASDHVINDIDDITEEDLEKAIEKLEDETSNNSSSTDAAENSLEDTTSNVSQDSTTQESKEEESETTASDKETVNETSSTSDNDTTSDKTSTDPTKTWGNTSVKEYIDDEYGIHFYLPSDLSVTIGPPLYNEGIVNRSYYVTGMGMQNEYLCQTQKCSDAVYNDSDAPEDELHGEIAHTDGYHYSINFINPETQYDFTLSTAMVDFINKYRQKILDSAWVDTKTTASSDEAGLDSSSNATVSEQQNADISADNAEAVSSEVNIDEILARAQKRSGAPIADLDSVNDDGTLVIHLYEFMEDHTATWDWYYINPQTLKGTDFMGGEVDLSK